MGFVGSCGFWISDLGLVAFFKPGMLGNRVVGSSLAGCC